ncbi:hypothetical protein NC652_037620 [Populus alba x Populus x berolinensis]|nr:hypothetical protein NC652_037608 [Populus alba x Populus x berolinensis]KAJ6866126.1 hypothetical protein NC652_037620 [Populus alba x Populus x berolinensis]
MFCPCSSLLQFVFLCSLSAFSLLSLSFFFSFPLQFLSGFPVPLFFLSSLVTFPSLFCSFLLAVSSFFTTVLLSVFLLLSLFSPLVSPLSLSRLSPFPPPVQSSSAAFIGQRRLCAGNGWLDNGLQRDDSRETRPLMAPLLTSPSIIVTDSQLFEDH